MNVITRSIKSRIFAISTLATLLIGAVLIWMGIGLKATFQEKSNAETHEALNLIKTVHDDEVRALGNGLVIGLEMLGSNPAAMQALQAGDRDALRSLLTPFYEECLNKKRGADILHFHTVDNHSFFRFHQPDQFGDDLSAYRQTIVEANQSGSIQTALEVGRFGIAFRVVKPLFLDGQPIGSVELSDDYLVFLDDLSKRYQVDVALAISTQALEKAGMESDPSLLKKDGLTYLTVQGEQLANELGNLSLESIQEDGTELHLDAGLTMVGFKPVVDLKGTPIGKLVLMMPIASSMKSVQNVIFKGAIALGVVGLLLGLLYFQQLNAAIFRPINTIVKFSKHLEQGDLSRQLSFKSKDEMGQIAASLGGLCQNLGQLLAGIKGDSVEVQKSAHDLNRVSDSLFQNTGDMRKRSSEIATGSSELTASLNAVTQTAKDGSANINMVARAGEEMSSTIAEIAENSEKTRTTMSHAVERIATANQRISDLEKAADEISQVIGVIVEISEQTKLLALNATIEAARAGEAGRGFNVVANEVKDLAAQTNGATEEIRRRIDAIQGTTQSTIEEFDRIRSVMTEANDMVTSIATAVEEQAVTTKGIADHIGVAADRVNDVDVTSSQSYEVASKITSEVADIDSASKEVYAGSTAIRDQADNMKQIGDDLAESIAKLKLAEG